MTKQADALVAVLSARVPRFAAWQPRALAAFEPVLDAGSFARVFAAAARQIGDAEVALTADDRAALERHDSTWLVQGRAADELARVWMLASAARRLPPATIVSLVADAYRHGELRERIAVLRALPLLPVHEDFVALAVDACRTSVQPVFEAIAAENPLPAARFPEPSFNQMVLKAVFTGLALGRIIGLDARRTPELARMAGDYASERRAAGRPVPADLARLMGDGGPE
jgi:hypothetical protein